jgi:hypothetical protein
MRTKGWKSTVDVEMLNGIKTHKMGPNHEIINHGFALTQFKNQLKGDVISENGNLSSDNMRYFYVATIKTKASDGTYDFQIGFINFNDQSKAFTVIAGERVLACTNMCFSQAVNGGKAKHIDSTNIDNIIGAGIKQFDDFTEKRAKQIDEMRKQKITEEILGKSVLGMHRSALVSPTFINRCIAEFDNPSFDYKESNNTKWSWLNAITHTTKELVDRHKYLLVTEQANNLVVTA